MASTEVDQKWLGNLAKQIGDDNPLLSSMLFKVLGLSVILTKQLVRARKLRKLDPTRATKSLDLYFHIIWLSREGLVILEQYILPMVQPLNEPYDELKALAFKIRATFYHIYVQFHNNPSVNANTPRHITTPPGLTSPRYHQQKGKPTQYDGLDPESRSSSVQPSHPLEGGPVQSTDKLNQRNSAPAADFLLPSKNYIPTTLDAFREADSLASRVLYGSHPLRLSLKVEYAAFLYDCMKDAEASRLLCKNAIADVYNANEALDDELFEDAAELVGVLGRMLRRGFGSGSSSGTQSTLKQTPRPSATQTQAPPLPENTSQWAQTPPLNITKPHKPTQTGAQTPTKITPPKISPPRAHTPQRHLETPPRNSPARHSMTPPRPPPRSSLTPEPLRVRGQPVVLPVVTTAEGPMI
jgi:hypothetical protein